MSGEARLIALAETPEQVARCYAVMRELRTAVRSEAEFVERVLKQLGEGYHLAHLDVGGEVVACAGYRYGNNLAWGKHLYVDDLVTASDARSGGTGGALLRWLAAEAHAHGCRQLHLDSGTQRAAAHRFYMREGMRISSYHFSLSL